jgi:two-component system, LytTR family, response regulator
LEKIRAILIDDEWNSLQNLQRKLEEFCPDVNVIGATQKPDEAITLIRQLRPDVIFLDIEMPRMNGFRLLEEIADGDFEIIFTTAYPHYTIEAIRISAFDYLMKPIAIKELQQAIERLRSGKQSGHAKEKFQVLKNALGPNKSQEEQIAIPTSEGLEFIPIHKIMRIDSDSNYSRLFLSDGTSLLVTRLLKDFEDMLVPYRFYRIHNSHLINLTFIKKYIRGEGGQVMMQNGDVIDVSRRKKEEFLKLILP